MHLGLQSSMKPIGWKFLVAILILIPCAFGMWLVVHGVLASLEAEKTLHASTLVLDLITEYCQKHPGAWPASWQDLMAACPPCAGGAGWVWPDDKDKIANRVKIDFKLTAKDVAASSPANFSAIRQQPPYYPLAERRVQELITTVRNGLDRKN